MKTQLTFLALAVLVAPSLFAQESSTENLELRNVERRAVEAIIWAMPAVNYELMLQQMLTNTKGQIVPLFQDREEAAQWLNVPVAVLMPDAAETS